jgi:hypothetical protein
MKDILLTAIATLIVTVVGGMLLNYLSKQRMKIKYLIRESTPMQLGEDKKYIAINLIEFWSATNTSIENTTVIIETQSTEIIKIEYSATNACKVEVKKNERSEIEILVPLLKKGDKVSVSILLENAFRWSGSLRVHFRNIKNVKIVNDDEKGKKEVFFVKYFGVGLLASSIVAGSLGIFTNQQTITNQKDHLVFIASISDFPELASYYNAMSDVKYFNQGDYIFAIAKKVNDKSEIRRYYLFLNNLINYIGNDIAGISKTAIFYSLAKLNYLLEDSSGVQRDFNAAIGINKAFVTNRLKYDKEFLEYLEKEAIYNQVP